MPSEVLWQLAPKHIVVGLKVVEKKRPEWVWEVYKVEDSPYGKEVHLINRDFDVKISLGSIRKVIRNFMVRPSEVKRVGKGVNDVCAS